MCLSKRRIALAFNDVIDVLDSDGNLLQSLPLEDDIDLMQFVDDNRIAIYHAQRQSRVLEVLDIATQQSLNCTMLDFNVDTITIRPESTCIAAGGERTKSAKGL